MTLPHRLFPLALVLLALTGCASDFWLRGKIRARAASDFGCGASDVQVDPIVGTGSYHATGCGQTGDYSCVATQYGRYGHTECGPDPDTTAIATPYVPTPAPAHVAAPIDDVAVRSTGAGGFVLGATAEGARTACEQASHQYSVTSDRFASCDGVVADVGAPARANLTFCDGKLCVVSLALAPQPGEGIARALARWKTALTERYGSPTFDSVSIPPSCYDDITPCLVNHTGTMSFDWRFRSGKRIRLMPHADASKAWLTIAYLASDRDLGGKPGL